LSPRPAAATRRLRLTRDGAIAIAVSVGLAVAAWWIGDNRLIWIAAAGIATAAADLGIGRRNLGSVEVIRRLPDDLFAGAACRGRWIVRNRGRSAGWSWWIAEGEQRSVAPTVPPGGEVEVPALWGFDRRGPASLGAIRVGSRFPFGWFEHELRLDRPAELLIYPCPIGRRSGGSELGAGLGDEAARGGPDAGTGEFVGLRPYRPGDPPRDLHWPTTARTGRPQVVQRASASPRRAVIRVDPQGDEEAIGRACGELLDAFDDGDEVSLILPDRALPPGTGDGWRRQLLAELAEWRRLPS
jgi:uncharacterized protein (DUF58 family)